MTEPKLCRFCRMSYQGPWCPRCQAVWDRKRFKRTTRPVGQNPISTSIHVSVRDLPPPDSV